MAPVAVGSVVAVGGVVACEPGGLSSAAVAYTTDQTVTRELERQKAEVRWLTCTASYGDRGGTASASENTVASVDCEGRTDGGKDITVDGKVTRVVNGACVRGNLTAEIDGKEWFRVKGLGNCDATSAPPANRPSPDRPGGHRDRHPDHLVPGRPALPTGGGQVTRRDGGRSSWPGSDPNLCRRAAPLHRVRG